MMIDLCQYYVENSRALVVFNIVFIVVVVIVLYVVDRFWVTNVVDSIDDHVISKTSPNLLIECIVIFSSALAWAFCKV